MKIKFGLLVLAFLSALTPVSAQRKLKKVASGEASKNRLAEIYVDSLLMCRQRIDSMKMDSGDSRYAQLFTPLTFYHGPAARMLRLKPQDGVKDSLGTMLDQTLMEVYLKRPDLVLNTESHLKEVGAPLAAQSTPKKYQTSKGDTVHTLNTSDDMIRYTGKLGLQASRKWYYTIQLIGQTQFTHGYKSNDKTVYSDFFSPFNLNLSVGMDYNVDWFNHRLKGSAHLAPLAFNWKYVGRASLATRYGLDEGKHGMTDYGSECTFDLSWQIADNIKWKTRLWGYTTYKRAEIEWENTITFQFNRYISTNIFLYPRFDDGVNRKDDDSYWQFKEFMSVGFSYSF